jgi:hypothetical protein
MTMEGNFFEGHIINESPILAHHSPILVDIVLILIFVNQIEISCYHPRPRTKLPGCHVAPIETKFYPQSPVVHQHRSATTLVHYP